MNRTTFLSTVLVFAFFSCSNDSLTHRVVGDYSGELLCVADNGPDPFTVLELLDNVEVLDSGEDRIEIKLNATLGSMFGSLDVSNDIMIDAFNGVLSDGTELNFISGIGSFSRDSLSVITLEKSIILFLEPEMEELGVCSLTLQGR